MGPRGIDFDDSEFGFKEEEKDELKVSKPVLMKNFKLMILKAKNEAKLRTLTEKCDGVFGTMAQAVAELGTLHVKAIGAYRTYAGRLTLGDPSSEKTLAIDVERLVYTNTVKPMSASQYVATSNMASGEASTQTSHTIVGNDQEAPNMANLAAVKSARTYQVIDDEAPAGKRDVEREDLAKGYTYGRTAVHISESDENVTKLETTASFEIVGFVASEKVRLLLISYLF